MARIAIGAPACASAVKRQTSPRNIGSGIVRDRRSGLRAPRPERRAFSEREPPELALVTDIDHLSLAISHATAPAFMLGAVAGFLSILIARLERVADKIRALRSLDAATADPSGALAASFSRRMVLLSRAIYFAVLSALVTAGFLIAAFVAALEGIGHARLVATMFALSLGLLIAALIDLTREIRVYMANMQLE
jgi:Protein of unknown function (DUF2721)